MMTLKLTEPKLNLEDLIIYWSRSIVWVQPLWLNHVLCFRKPWVKHLTWKKCNWFEYNLLKGRDCIGCLLRPTSHLFGMCLHSSCGCGIQMHAADVVGQHLASATLRISCVWPWIFSATSKWVACGKLLSHVAKAEELGFHRATSVTGDENCSSVSQVDKSRCSDMAPQKFLSGMVFHLFTEVIGSMVPF